MKYIFMMIIIALISACGDGEFQDTIDVDEAESNESVRNQNPPVQNPDLASQDHECEGTEDGNHNGSGSKSPDSKGDLASDHNAASKSQFNESCVEDSECVDGLQCTCADNGDCSWGRCRVACDVQKWPQTQCPANYSCFGNFCYTKDEISRVIEVAVEGILPKKKPKPIKPQNETPPIVIVPEVAPASEEVAIVAVPNPVQNIFSQKCASCHNPQGIAAGTGLFLTDAETSFERLVEVAAKGNPSLDRVSPGDPNNSVLVKRIENGSMPLGGAKLPAAEINLIRQWIESL